MSIALLLEFSRRRTRSRDGSAISAVSSRDEVGGKELLIMIIVLNVHGILQIQAIFITLGSTVDKDKGTTLKDVNISSHGSLVLLHYECGVIDVARGALPGTDVPEPGHTASLFQNPVIRKRGHCLAAIVLNALFAKIVIADVHVRTPDDDPLLRVQNAGEAGEIRLPTPEVLFSVADEPVNGSGDDFALKICDLRVERDGE